MKPDASAFYDTKQAAILLNITEGAVRKILRRGKSIISQQYLVNKRPCYFIEKWIFRIFLENEIARYEKHIEFLRKSLSNPEEQIINGKQR